MLSSRFLLKMLHLVVQLYPAGDEAVIERMVKCISSNLRLGCISRMTIVCEGINLTIDSPKVEVARIDHRATYSDLLEIALASSDEQITHCGIANTDIYFSDDLERLIKVLMDPVMVAAISRHEVNGMLHPDPKWSQDAWIFKRHVPSNDFLQACNYSLGIAGCEHHFAMALHVHGYSIWNPCIDCKIVHADPSPRNVFSQRYYGAYLLLPPCKIEDISSTPPRYEMAISRSPFQGDSSQG